MSDFIARYAAARKAAIARDFAKLNPEQRRGVLTTEGALLLLAGAGSGKTTVLINRVANLLTYGRGSDSEEVPQWATEDDLVFLESYPAHQTAEERSRMVHLCALEPAAPWSLLRRSPSPPPTPARPRSCASGSLPLAFRVRRACGR